MYFLVGQGGVVDFIWEILGWLGKEAEEQVWLVGDFIRGVWVVGDEEADRVALWEISFGGDWVIVEVLLVRDLEIRSGKL